MGSGVEPASEARGKGSVSLGAPNEICQLRVVRAERSIGTSLPQMLHVKVAQKWFRALPLLARSPYRPDDRSLAQSDALKPDEPV